MTEDPAHTEKMPWQTWWTDSIKSRPGHLNVSNDCNQKIAMSRIRYVGSAHDFQPRGKRLNHDLPGQCLLEAYGFPGGKCPAVRFQIQALFARAHPPISNHQSPITSHQSLLTNPYPEPHAHLEKPHERQTMHPPSCSTAPPQSGQAPIWSARAELISAST